jgi:hypothetical protein
VLSVRRRLSVLVHSGRRRQRSAHAHSRRHGVHTRLGGLRSCSCVIDDLLGLPYMHMHEYVHLQWLAASNEQTAVKSGSSGSCVQLCMTPLRG